MSNETPAFHSQSMDTTTPAYVIDVKPKITSPLTIEPTRNVTRDTWSEQLETGSDAMNGKERRQLVLSRLKDKLKSSGNKTGSAAAEHAHDERMDEGGGLPPQSYQLPRVLDADFMSRRDVTSDDDFDMNDSSNSFSRKFGSATFPRSYKEDGRTGPFPQLDLASLSISTEAKLETAKFTKKGLYMTYEPHLCTVVHVLLNVFS